MGHGLTEPDAGRKPSDSAESTYKCAPALTLKLIREEPDHRAYVRFSLLSGGFHSIGLESYILRHSLGDVRDALALAAFAGRQTAEIRLAQSRSPVVVDSEPFGPVLSKKLPPPDPGPDYSVGNPTDNFEWVATALVAGEFDLAGQVAALAWDPPNADYISPSAYVTPSDQGIAYSVRHLFAGEPAATLDELKRVKPGKRELAFTDHVDIARMIRALAVEDSVLFLEGLHGLLKWHAKAAIRPSNRNGPEFFLSLPGQALATFGLERGLISRESLPQDDPYLSMELIDLARTQGRSDFREFPLDTASAFVEKLSASC